MRIAQINLPLQGNNGENLNHVHYDLGLKLIAEFGGFTTIEGKGGWRGENYTVVEPVAVYQVAYEYHFNDALNIITSIAVAAGKAADQEAMFVVIDGEAEIITIT